MRGLLLSAYQYATKSTAKWTGVQLQQAYHQHDVTAFKSLPMAGGDFLGFAFVWLGSFLSSNSGNSAQNKLDVLLTK